MPLVPLWNELEWRERNPVACAARKGKKSRGGVEWTRWELAADCLCSALLSVIGQDRRPRVSAHFLLTFLSCPAAITTVTKPPQQLCYCWTRASQEGPGAGVEGQVGGVGDKGEALLWEAQCYTNKVVKEKMAQRSFVRLLYNRNLWHRVSWSGLRQTNRRHFYNHFSSSCIVVKSEFN